MSWTLKKEWHIVKWEKRLQIKKVGWAVWSWPAQPLANHSWKKKKKDYKSIHLDSQANNLNTGKSWGLVGEGHIWWQKKWVRWLREKLLRFSNFPALLETNSITETFLTQKCIEHILLVYYKWLITIWIAFSSILSEHLRFALVTKKKEKES